MKNYIVEYVGPKGVISTPYYDTLGKCRFENPKSGDVVRIPPKLRRYPFTNEYARVESRLNGSTLSVCCEMGDAFLLEIGAVCISGGPFARIPCDCLTPTYCTYPTSVWNWGDHSPDAGQGVGYVLPRPVFDLVRLPDCFRAIG